MLINNTHFSFYFLLLFLLFAAVSSSIGIHCSNCQNPGFTQKCDRICKNCKGLLSYSCKKCDKPFKAFKYVENHLVNICENLTKLVCSYCEYRTPYKASMDLHIQTRHSNDFIPPSLQNCRFCNKKFTSLVHMKRHKKLCGTNQLFQCGICPYSTKYRSALRVHEMRHRQNKI